MPYQIEIICLGKDNYEDIEVAINVLNTIQGEFRYSIPPLRLRNDGFSYDLEEYHSSEVFDWQERYRETAKGNRQYLIGVINAKLRSKRWTNLFGSSRATRGLAVFTLIDQSRFTDSRISFICYYLLRYTLGFIGPEIKSHEEFKNCFFHFKREKDKIKDSLTAGKLCDVCTKKFQKYFNVEIVEGMNKLANAVKDIEDDEKTYLKNLPKVDRGKGGRLPHWLQDWWFVSICVGFFGFLVSSFLIENWKWGLLIGFFAGVITFLKNPKTRFMRAFWAVLSLLISINYFSINLILDYVHRGEQDNLKAKLTISEPSVIISILLVILLIVLAVLDYMERKKGA